MIKGGYSKPVVIWSTNKPPDCLMNYPNTMTCISTALPVARTQVNTLRPRKHCRHFFPNTLLNEHVRSLIKDSLQFVLNGLADNASIQVIAWFRTGDKPLSETIMVEIADAISRHSPSLSYRNVAGSTKMAQRRQWSGCRRFRVWQM